jgi:hypothetical protein
MLKELLMSSIKGEVKKKHCCIGRNFSCLMTSECWLSHIADSSFSCYYPVALSDTLGHDANEDQVLVSPLIGIWLFNCESGGPDPISSNRWNAFPSQGSLMAWNGRLNTET